MPKKKVEDTDAPPAKKRGRSKKSKAEPKQEKKTTKKKSKKSKKSSSKKRSKVTTSKPDGMTRALGMINKIKGLDKAHVPLSEDDLSETQPHIPTGSLIIDYCIGGPSNRYGVPACPGVPRGGITQIYGPEGAGKSTIAQMTMATACSIGGRGCYIDWEHVLKPDYADALGVPTQDSARFLLMQPNTLEEGMKIAWIMAREGVDLIVFDSVGAGVPAKIFGQKDDEVGNIGQIGLVASKWNAFLPKFQALISQSKTAVIAISQMRANITSSQYAKKTKPQGGHSWKYYSSVRLDLARTKQIKEKRLNRLTHVVEDKIVAATMRVTVDKSKVSATAGMRANFFLRHGEGIDNTTSVIEIGKKYGILKGNIALSWEAPDGEVVKTRSAKVMRTHLKNRPDHFQILYGLVIQALRDDPNDSGDSDEYDEMEKDVDADLDLDDLVGV